LKELVIKLEKHYFKVIFSEKYFEKQVLPYFQIPFSAEWIFLNEKKYNTQIKKEIELNSFLNVHYNIP
jgi:hypothetical protein